jgi:hypothetical protein
MWKMVEKVRISNPVDMLVLKARQTTASFTGLRDLGSYVCENVVSSRVGTGDPIQSRSGTWWLGVLSQHPSFTAGLPLLAFVSRRCWSPYQSNRDSKRLEQHGFGLDWKQA